MKKSLIALAVLGFAGAAMAQSSVTLYGAWSGRAGQADQRPPTCLGGLKKL